LLRFRRSFDQMMIVFQEMPTHALPDWDQN
jgi:hypothetical protein